MSPAIRSMHSAHDLAPTASSKIRFRSALAGWLRLVGRWLATPFPDRDTIAGDLLSGSQWSDSTERDLHRMLERYPVTRFK